MAETKVRVVQRGGIDLSTFTEVTLKKVVPPMQAVTSVEDALARLGNDSARLLAVITRGLQAEHDHAVLTDPNIPWRTTNEDGKLNGEFTGILADIKKVNQFVLVMAKTQFGFDKDAPKEQKAKAKEAAREFVRGLINSGVLKSDGFMPDSEEDEEEEEETPTPTA
jgi:hypothetical protein